MKLLFPSDSFDRVSIGQHLLKLGFIQVSDPPVTSGARWTTWQRGEDAVAYGTRSHSATTALKVAGPSEDTLSAELTASFQARAPHALLAAPAAARLARLRHIAELGTLSWLDLEGTQEARQALLALLLSEDHLVRWSALHAVAIADRTIADAVGKAAERYPDLRGAHQRLHQACLAAEEGTANDYDTDDEFELLERAREGADRGQWRRVAKATNAILAGSPWNEEALFLRALAHEGEGEALEALFLLGGVEYERQLQLRAKEEENDEDEDNEDDGDEDGEGDDGEQDDEGEADASESLQDVQQRMTRLRELAAQLSTDERERAAQAAHRWLRTWEEKSQGGLAYGGARALRGHAPSLDGLLTFIEGRHQEDEQHLHAALAFAPDSPSVARALAQAIQKRDAAEGRRRLAELRELLRAPRELSPQARQIEDFVATREDRTTDEASVVELLALEAYQANRYDEAAALADELVALDPDSQYGWQVRANARIFALRHEESVLAYDEALAAIDRIQAEAEQRGSFFFGNPRPGLLFNRCCALSKLGRKREALDSLRAAVLGDQKYAAMALEDDYLEPLFDDPEFQGITSGDRQALRTEQERDPAWIRALVARARDQQQAGDHGAALQSIDRADELASYLDFPALRIETLAILGRIQAFNGLHDEALATSERAAHLARDPAVDPEIRAMASAQRGICLQLTGDLEQAEAAYRHAFDVRRTALGDAHPSLVKSLVSLAEVAASRGRAAGEAEGYTSQGIDIATRWLEQPHPRDFRWAEVIDDLVGLLVRRALLKGSQGDLTKALQALNLALDRVQEQQAAGHAPMRVILEQLRSLAEQFGTSATSPQQAQEANQARLRAEEQLFPGTPDERRLRLSFHRLRNLISELRVGGVEEERIASILQDVVRGGASLSPEIQNIPALAELRRMMALAAAHHPTLLVTGLMALQMAGMPGQLDSSLTQLEELVVPALLERGVSEL